MEYKRNFLTFFNFFILFSYAYGDISERREEDVSTDRRYIVGWVIDFDTGIVTFDVTVASLGYIGFGLSANGAMGGADIVIMGVKDGNGYLEDYHGIGQVSPVLDSKQDYQLQNSWQNGTHTHLKFSRLLETCDKDDATINDDTIRIIWSFGSNHTIVHHGYDNRGNFVTNLMDPAIPEVATSAETVKVWELTVNRTMRTEATTYWCTIHKGLNFGSKHHVIGFTAHLQSADALKHTHHFVLYRCNPPFNKSIPIDEFYKPFLYGEGHDGDECYTPDQAPYIDLCKVFMFVFSIGGRPMRFPENAGFPVGLNSSEYYMLEVHYDNPQSIENLKFETGVDILYTPDLREHDAGMLILGHTIKASLIVPPKSEAFIISGHCSSDCTSKKIPPAGVKIFNLLMHSHLAGRKLRLRHFRGDVELPWLGNDENYDFNYQQNKPLRNEVDFLPGDQLTYECTYNSMDRDGVIISELGTKDEMCEVFGWYYPAAAIEICSSEFYIDALYPEFGIENVTWQYGLLSQPVVTAPEALFNLTFEQAINVGTNWTQEHRASLQQKLRYEPHISICFKADEGNFDPTLVLVSYPANYTEYAPEDMCSSGQARYVSWVLLGVFLVSNI